MCKVNLWHSLEKFEIGQLDSELTFAQRLARDNNWDMEFAEECILEYKKYLYLVVIQKKTMTPSDAVDQVWHLHLNYTKSYWIDLCKN